MKVLTHCISATIVSVTTILCMPGIHDTLLVIAHKNPYLTTIIPAILTVAALYHTPKQSN